KKYPSQLSGGMRQRAALIRTLALRPAILLLDEPFSALDYQTRLAVSDDIYKIIKEQKKTAIMVTHDIAESVSLSDRVIILSARPATVKKILKITFAADNLSPLQKRDAPEFKSYFNTIWKELDVHVQ
ncbi:MAG: spermidine/putrescine ABC transporter ATP-binding protein, partial [Clostridiales bacterium]